MPKTNFINKEECGCSRRDFLSKSFKSLSAIALGSFAVTFINACSEDDSPTSPSSSGDDNTGGTVEITVDISQSENSALQNVGGIVALGGNAIDSNGIFLIRESASSVIALSRTCTHQACQVGAFSNDGVATCPCHGSSFNTSGNVLGGPAGSPLPKYSASLDGNVVTITK